MCTDLVLVATLAQIAQAYVPLSVINGAVVGWRSTVMVRLFSFSEDRRHPYQSRKETFATSQRAQYPLIKEYTLNTIRIPYII